MQVCAGLDGIPCPELATGPRCITHEREYRRRQGSSTARGYGQPHRRRTAAAIDAEPWCHCTGDHAWHRGRDCGATTNLTGQHVSERGPGWSDGLIVPFCGRCNSADGSIRRARLRIARTFANSE